MAAEFVKMVEDVHKERFPVHLGNLAHENVPCGIFFGFDVVPLNVIARVKNLLDIKINLSCVILLADVQAAVLRKFLDIPVITLEDFNNFGEKGFPDKPKTIFIPGGLKDCGFAPYFARNGMETLTFSDDFIFFFTMTHLTELYAVYNMLGGEESKKVFLSAIKGRLTGKIYDFRFAPEAQYFLEGFYPKMGDIAIDGGAFDGATSISFAKCGAKVFSFEMDAQNYKNCVNRLKGSNFDITLENFGLSDKESVENYVFNHTGTRKLPQGNLKANFIDLDTYFAKKNLPRVDYIKLDIEGSELDMLHGAAKTISRFKPKMAVSAYHRLEDLWTLATYIKNLRPDYEFEFRHYQIDCTDYTLNDEERDLLKYFGLKCFLPTNCEMVLYCR